MAGTLPYPLLPAFVLQLPEQGRTFEQLPWRSEPIALDEGSHLSYAIQWMLFAVILGIGYIQYVRWIELRERRIAAAGDSSVATGGDAGDSVNESS
jgi:cytochrome oxidase assembly protein ShyY1